MHWCPADSVLYDQAKADAAAPLADFKKIFPLVVLVSLGMVLLLSSIQIRRSLVPLEKLKEGTDRIAARDFDSQVVVTSGDEFEELAVSFNAMSNRLGKQFNTLTTIAEIDNAILAALDTERIIETVLMRMRDVLPCDVVSVTLIESNETNIARTYTRSDHQANKSRVKTVEIDPEDIERLRRNPERLLIEGDKDLPQYLHDIGKIGIEASILDKPGKLTDEEYQVIKEHPGIGARILEPIGAYARVTPMVLQHHEWFNGKGYPGGLAGETICLGARILAVADVFDSLISDRPYRAGWERERAASFIKDSAGRQFDPNAVHAFSELMVQAERELRR